MLECIGLSLTLGGREILKDVSFRAEKGCVTVLTGKNGSGKTSLLRCLCGELKYSGDVLLSHENIKNKKTRELAKSIALLPQLLPRPAVPVSELVSYGRFPYLGLSGRPGEADRAAVEAAAEAAGIAGMRDSLVSELSGGERQLCYFAMVIAEDCPVVLLDEPTSNLDTVYTQKVLSLIRGMRDEGRTVVTVMHDLDEAVLLADRIVTVDGGRIVFDGAARAFTESDIPEKVFFKKYTEVTDDGGNRFGVFRST
ncbi:MAG: ABC transporter ATP-binding protein [Clostridia bacterium]|nr:ABC transporter ATP-binding protein [Clostridia bacterium]